MKPSTAHRAMPGLPKTDRMAVHNHQRSRQPQSSSFGAGIVSTWRAHRIPCRIEVGDVAEQVPQREAQLPVHVRCLQNIVRAGMSREQSEARPGRLDARTRGSAVRAMLRRVVGPRRPSLSRTTLTATSFPGTLAAGPLATTGRPKGWCRDRLYADLRQDLGPDGDVPDRVRGRHPQPQHVGAVWRLHLLVLPLHAVSAAW